MITIKFKRNYLDYSEGETAELTNNIAHGLIEAGIASLFYEDKVMTPQESKTYKIKGK